MFQLSMLIDTLNIFCLNFSFLWILVFELIPWRKIVVFLKGKTNLQIWKSIPRLENFTMIIVQYSNIRQTIVFWRCEVAVAFKKRMKPKFTFLNILSTKKVNNFSAIAHFELVKREIAMRDNINSEQKQTQLWTL